MFAISIALKFRAATMSMAQRFLSQASIAIAASSAASAADLAPTPAPIEGWTITLGADPGFSRSFLERKAYRFGRPAIFPTGRPGEPSHLFLPTMDLALLSWTFLGSRLVPVRGFISQAAQRRFGSLSTTTISTVCIISLHGRTRRLSWNSGDRLLFAPAWRARQGVSGSRASMATSNSISSSDMTPLRLRPAPAFQFGDDQFMSDNFLVTPAEAF